MRTMCLIGAFVSGLGANTRRTDAGRKGGTIPSMRGKQLAKEAERDL